MNKKELKVVLQTDINVLLDRALPLCVILTDERLIPWYYEHFVQIYVVLINNEYAYADFLEHWAPYRTLCEQMYVGNDFMSNVKDIISFTKERIERDCYMIINLDEYFVKNKDTYLNLHQVRQLLVYGYDDEKEEIKAIGFDKNMTFNKITLEYEEYITAFESGKKYYKESAPWCENCLVEMLVFRNFRTSYPFSIAKFMSKLKDYIESKGDYSIVFTKNMDSLDIEDYSQVKFGLDLYEVLIEHLQGKYSSDYRFVHLLYESKKAIYKRFEYISKNYISDGSISEDIKEYYLFVKKLDLIRLKYIYLNEQMNSGKSTKKLSLSIIKLINEVKDKEKEKLIEIYNKIKNATIKNKELEFMRI